jgi:hypothetical protein
VYCPECGSDIGDGKFCPRCGTNLDLSEGQQDSVRTSEGIVSDSTIQTEMISSSKYSLGEFVKRTIQKDVGEESFELENDYILDLNLNGMVWTKIGSMVAYNGNVKFKREGTLEHGLGKLVKKAVTGEATTLMKVKGQCHVYLADMGKKVTILNLQNEKIYVNGNDVLAFEEGIDWDIKIMSKGSI